MAINETTLTTNENLILEAIVNDDVQFFEDRKHLYQNWAMHKIKHNGFSVPCLGVAIALGSEEIFHKLLNISQCTPQQFDQIDISGEAINSYYQAVIAESPNLEKIEKLISILKTLIRKGTNPYINSDEEGRNILYYISQLENNPIARSRELFEIILDSSSVIPLRNIVKLLQTVQDQQFFIEEIKGQYGSLDLTSMSGSLLIAAIHEGDFNIAKLLVENGAGVNFCGLGQSSPLRVLQDKITRLDPSKKQELKELRLFENYLQLKGAKSFLNPFFNSKLRPFIDLKEISIPNKNWTELSMNALKKAALEEDDKCIKYLSSNNNNNDVVDFSCNSKFIDLCKDFLKYQTNLSHNDSFCEKIRAILRAHHIVEITAQTLSPKLKSYFPDNYQASSYRDLTLDLFKKVKEQKIEEVTRKGTGCLSIYYSIPSPDDDVFMQRLTLPHQFTAKENKDEIERLSKGLKLSSFFQSAINELSTYLNNPEPCLTSEPTKS